MLLSTSQSSTLNEKECDQSERSLCLGRTEVWQTVPTDGLNRKEIVGLQQPVTLTNQGSTEILHFSGCPSLVQFKAVVRSKFKKVKRVEQANIKSTTLGNLVLKSVKVKGENVKELEPCDIKPESFQTSSDPPMRGVPKSTIKKAVVKKINHPSSGPPRNCPRNPNFFHSVTVW